MNDTAKKHASLVEVANENDLGDESSRLVTDLLPSVVQKMVDDERRLDEEVFSINSFPAYIPEEQNPNILIKGRWLERGGSAWWISTAGTGKSIASVQATYCWGAGIPFCGLVPHRKITSWIIQSEDSPSRITIDREDIVAELSEQMPDVDWRQVAAERVYFVKCKTSVSGVLFFKEIGRLLETARRMDEQNEGKSGYVRRFPDLIVVNPFLGFVGGPVTDGAYVTPFLRGGVINGEPCEGLQPFLERFNIAALLYHHTPKPPNDKEVETWIKSQFPEYQGAGSSEITNWGRSFLTMMKCPGHPKIVCLTAGKNGGEIGWQTIDGCTRRYMAWSEGISITGGGRHAWRELNADEYEEIVEKKIAETEKFAAEDAETLAKYIIGKGKAYKSTDFRSAEILRLMTKRRACAAAKLLFADPKRFGLIVRNRKDGYSKANYISGSESAIETTSKHDVERAAVEVRYDAHMKQQQQQQSEDRRLSSGRISDLPPMPEEDETDNTNQNEETDDGPEYDFPF